ncbi:restriction endonuclease subunit S [Stutzerimonas nitrititolerans]|uniref:restriction endonuclease subunit S n=1 Tax=Stutzerimonas nitrititolerans TaxID=2482751 RepID=UPI0028AECE9F|nr:restriction endonuclease subunit S [Stutzerimonas nitrititolerans]
MGYQAYPEYKESGVEWLGKVPADWEVQRLKFVASHNDETLPENTDDQYEIEYVDISSVDLVQGITSTENMPFEKAPSRARRVVRHGDTLVSTVRTYLKAIAAVSNPPDNLIASTGFTVIRANNEIDTGFLACYLQSQGFVDAVVANSTGVSYPAINASDLVCLSVAYPADKKEQAKIAQFLDHKTAQIDRLIEKKQELIEKLQEERVTIITQVVTRGLTPTITLKDSGVEWLGKIPRHWQCVGFTKSISSQVDYRGKTPEKVQEGVFLVTAKNIKDGTINYELSKEYVRDDQYDEIMSRGKPEIGDLLFTTEAPLGEVANIDRTDIALAQRVIKFRGEATKLDNYFARYWFMSRPFQDHLKSLATGSTALGIKASKLFELRIALPPFEEQVSIRNFLDERLQALTATEAKITEAIESLQEYRTALITAAVTGQIDVRDWQAPEPIQESAANKEVA